LAQAHRDPAEDDRAHQDDGDPGQHDRDLVLTRPRGQDQGAGVGDSAGPHHAAPWFGGCPSVHTTRRASVAILQPSGVSRAEPVTSVPAVNSGSFDRPGRWTWVETRLARKTAERPSVRSTTAGELRCCVRSKAAKLSRWYAAAPARPSW